MERLIIQNIDLKQRIKKLEDENEDQHDLMLAKDKVIKKQEEFVIKVLKRIDRLHKELDRQAEKCLTEEEFKKHFRKEQKPKITIVEPTWLPSSEKTFTRSYKEEDLLEQFLNNYTLILNKGISMIYNNKFLCISSVPYTTKHKENRQLSRNTL